MTTTRYTIESRGAGFSDWFIEETVDSLARARRIVKGYRCFTSGFPADSEFRIVKEVVTATVVT